MLQQELPKTFENLQKQFVNTLKFSNNDINKFTLLLQKCASHMNAWMIGKNLMKHYMKKKILQSPKHGRYYDTD